MEFLFLEELFLYKYTSFFNRLNNYNILFMACFPQYTTHLTAVSYLTFNLAHRWISKKTSSARW